MPDLEDGFAIPPPPEPRKKARKPERLPNLWDLLIARARHGQSILVPACQRATVKMHAQKAGWEVRWQDKGYGSTKSKPHGTRLYRLWFIDPRHGERELEQRLPFCPWCACKHEIPGTQEERKALRCEAPFPLATKLCTKQTAARRFRLNEVVGLTSRVAKHAGASQASITGIYPDGITFDIRVHRSAKDPYLELVVINRDIFHLH